MDSNEERVVGKLIQKKGRIHKDRAFLFFKDEKITYAQLDLLSNRFAHGYRDLGIQTGDKIAVMMNNHPNYLYAWFGAAKLGAVEVPINTAYKGDLLRYIINHSDSKLLIIDSSLLERLIAIRDDLTRLKQIICHGEIDMEISKSLPVTLSSIDDFFHCSSDPVEMDISPSEPAGIIYTSGTTGPSKGVVCPHNYFLHTARLVARLRKANSRDVLYTFLPLFHINAQLMTILTALVADAQAVLSDRFRASTFWDEIIRFGATQFNYLGAVMTILSKQEPREDEADMPVRIAFGAACPPDVMRDLEKRFGFICLEGFGM